MILLVEKIVRIIDKNKWWDEGIEIIGSWCFYFYQECLGLESYPLRTQDIDFLVPNRIKNTSNIDLIEEIEKLGFRHSFNRDGSIYLWNSELKIEFITPDRGRGTDKAIAIKNSTIRAIPLRFVDLLLENPVRVKYKKIHILLPSPENFLFHKLLISDRRKEVEKREKDFIQAIYTYSITDNKKLSSVYDNLPKPWQKKIVKVLKEGKERFVLVENEIEEILNTLQK